MNTNPQNSPQHDLTPNMTEHDTECIFCQPDNITTQTPLTWAVKDNYPVNPGHHLIIPKRHIINWWAATPEEQQDILDVLHRIKTQLDATMSPDGYNVGFNDGAAAGQTIFHLHVHIIPRYENDMENPRGGVRHVIPKKANY